MSHQRGRVPHALSMVATKKMMQQTRAANPGQEQDKRLLRERQRLENVEPVRRGRQDRSGQLRVPVHLLDVGLTLVAEQQLRRHVLEPIRIGAGRPLVLVFLDRQVPQRDLVVGARGSEARVFCRVPFDRGDRSRVPGERGDGCRRRGFRAAESGSVVSHAGSSRTICSAGPRDPDMDECRRKKELARTP